VPATPAAKGDARPDARRRHAFDPQTLAQLRDLPLSQALDRLGLHVSRDRDFVPVKDPRTERWYVSAGAGVCELLVTGIKWFDASARKGGGGAIDLTMHLLGLGFAAAVKRLGAEAATAAAGQGAPPPSRWSST
jgi:hypothetical protein